MIIFYRNASLLMLFGLLTTAQAEDMPGADDYAYGWTVAPEQTADFYEVELPLEVYQSATSPTLRDLGIYNQNGNPIPRQVIPPVQEAEVIETLTALIPLPLYEGQLSSSGDLRLLVKHGNAETTVELKEFAAPGSKARPNNRSQANTRLAAYIIDVHKPELRFAALDLTWPETIDGFMAHVVVHGSNDLKSWRPVGSGSITSLSRDGAMIEQRRIELNTAQYEYLQLTWNGVPAGWSLTGVNGIQRSKHEDTNRKLIALPVSGRDDKDGGYIFTTDGIIPVDQIGLILPDDNTTVRARIYAWQEPAQRWRAIIDSHFYHLRGGGDAMVSKPLPLTVQRTGRWKVIIDSGRPELDFKLELGWRPEMLVFVAQGAGPFQVVAGRAADQTENYPQHRLYNDPALAALARDNKFTSAATLGNRIELAGPEQLVLPYTPDWRRWLIWAGLIGGVLLVGGMAASLIRQLKKE